MKAMIIIEDTEDGVTFTPLRIKTVGEINGNVGDTGTAAGALCANLENIVTDAQERAKRLYSQEKRGQEQQAGKKPCLH